MELEKAGKRGVGGVSQKDREQNRGTIIKARYPTVHVATESTNSRPFLNIPVIPLKPISTVHSLITDPKAKIKF